MGHNSDRLAGRFGVSREEQDAFALRSHQNAHKAHQAGLYKQVSLVNFAFNPLHKRCHY
jgi:acetyl-CoA acetyltransferase